MIQLFRLSSQILRQQSEKHRWWKDARAKPKWSEKLFVILIPIVSIYLSLRLRRTSKSTLPCIFSIFVICNNSCPARPSISRSNCAFYSDDGGFRSTDENDLPTSQLYFMGIIDILTPYDMKKKTEHYWKSMTQDKVSFSREKFHFLASLYWLESPSSMAFRLSSLQSMDTGLHLTWLRP